MGLFSNPGSVICICFCRFSRRPPDVLLEPLRILPRALTAFFYIPPLFSPQFHSSIRDPSHCWADLFHRTQLPRGYLPPGLTCKPGPLRLAHWPCLPSSPGPSATGGGGLTRPPPSARSWKCPGTRPRDSGARFNGKEPVLGHNSAHDQAALTEGCSFLCKHPRVLRPPSPSWQPVQNARIGIISVPWVRKWGCSGWSK